MNSRFLSVLVLALALTVGAANNQILGWNNLGMHCMDSDYSVFSILPPYNTIEAQLIVGGKLVTNGAGYTVTYQAVADPAGSFNSTSIGKGNYANYVQTLYGPNYDADQGLAGWNMPGISNTPQTMLFEVTNQPSPVAHSNVLTRVNWWRAEGIPLSPYDDALNKNPYPLMRLIAKSSSTPIATNDIVLPVSDEMDCRACHASGTQAAAKPAAGWVWDGIQERDFRLNILRLHDEINFASNAVLYAAALADRGFNPQGLYRGVVADNHPVLCAKCHDSEALGTGSYGTIPPLTASIHSFHARVIDPLTSLTLDSLANRSACYRCHPGSTTKCLRGAMGGAIAADGSMEMQCQSCHGNMSSVGSPARVGWFMEPNCASCHTGTATSNAGQIRYVSVFTNTSTWGVRTNFDQTFSTQPDIPAGGLSLYRFSAGHGGLQCEACHGSTHAEFPSTHVNDNVRNQNIQGHAGVMMECTACHTAMPNTITGGPHGLHPVDNNWALNHGDLFEGTPAAATRQQCQACHGSGYTGTVLSRAQGNRSLNTKFGTPTFWRGRVVSCYDCHDGANSSNPSSHPPVTVVATVKTNTVNGAAVAMSLTATGGGTLTWRVVNQPAHGAVAVSNNTATYLPDPGFVGIDAFTFAANDTWVDSVNLGTGTVTVAQGPYSLGLVAHVPTNAPAGWPAAFAAVPAVTNYSGPVTFIWNFGDGSPHDTNQFPVHAYAGLGAFAWNVTATAGNVPASASGNIAIGPPVVLSLAHDGGQLVVSWPDSSATGVLEESAVLGAGAQWIAVTNLPSGGGNLVNIPMSTTGTKYYRVRQAW